VRRLSLLLAAAGCQLEIDREVQEPELEQSRVEHRWFPLPYMAKLDILVVVDSAPTMEGEQATLALNARAIVDVLRQYGGLPDLHLAVVDSDLGTLGVDVGDPRCASSGSAGRLTTRGCGVAREYLAREIDAWGEPHENYTGDLADAFACVVERVGVNGCPWRQPLEAMRRGLDHGSRIGFLRDDAILAVVFLGDADDCSAADSALYAPSSPNAGPRDPFRCFVHGVVCDGVDDPDAPGPRTGCGVRADDLLLRSIVEYKASLLAWKPDPRNVVVAAVTPAGDVVVEPGPHLAESCRAGTSAGTPAIRMRAFLEQFPDRHVYTSTCEDDWTGALGQISSLYPCTVARADEDRRIRDHLLRVENELRAADVRRLDQGQRTARARNIDRLHAYGEANTFPRNENALGPTPIFVDEHGTRCAMADLVERAGGDELVHRVAAARNTAYVSELAEDPALVAWLDRNGLTAREAARIQPTYCHLAYGCIEGMPIDRDPDTRGIQPWITVTLSDDSVDPSNELAIPPCGRDLPCFRVEPEPVECADTPSELAIRVEPRYFDHPGWARAEILVE
jgi:hypothetical protein